MPIPGSGGAGRQLWAAHIQESRSGARPVSTHTSQASHSHRPSRQPWFQRARPGGAMLRPWSLHGAARLLSLCLLTQCHLHALGEETRPGDASPKAGELQLRSLPGAASHEESEDDLFPDVDPKVLAAVLLQALRTEPGQKPANGRRDPEASADEERVRSRTQSSDVEAEQEQERGWDAVSREDARVPEEEERPEGLQAVLEQFQRDGPAAKREEPGREAQATALPDDDQLLQDLQAFEPRRANAKRKAPPGEPWSGARKLRQQQHLEHQLLQRRYEELAESRRQAEEARRAAAEEERLADMASDLLLQYLLKDGEEDEEEGRQGTSAREESEEAPGKGSSLLFEDEEGNVAEDKRSNEAPEGEGQDGADEEDIDPGTIDRLIELSSKLHLPADDVIDIINDVEKKKKDVPEPSKKSKALPVPPPPPQSPREKPWKGALRHRPQPWPLQKPRRPHLPKQDEAAWNEVLPGDEYPARAKWAPAKPGQELSNYISPRTFQPLAAHRFRHLPGPAAHPRGRYYDNNRAPDRDEELDNYIERVLMERPKVFQ